MDQPTVVEQIDAELQVPWSTVFLPDGTAVISERESALLRTIAPGAGGGRAGTLGKVPDVVPGGEGGLLGLALSPDFATDRYLYAYFTAAGDNRIARLRLEERGGTLELGPSEVIFSGIPKAATHNGGRIRFGPDGYLYVGTGDSQRREQPQDVNALGGKILRITPEGRPAPGNPVRRQPGVQPGPPQRPGTCVGQRRPAVGERIRARRRRRAQPDRARRQLRLAGGHGRPAPRQASWTRRWCGRRRRSPRPAGWKSSATRPTWGRFAARGCGRFP